MSFLPNLYKNKTKKSQYKTSDVWIDGLNFVEDHARDNGNIMYILCVPQERGVALKAYINSYKLNFTKAIDFETDNSTFLKVAKEYGMDISYDVSLDIPAGTMEEGRNNLAKIAELQKLLAPMFSVSKRSGTTFGISKKFPSQVPYFSVLFKNLISSGNQYSSYPTPTDVTLKQIINLGFICKIEEIKYEPDMTAGFFEHDTLLIPKNIKLNLKLEYAIETSFSAKALNSGFNEPSVPFIAFRTNGHYGTGDSGTFPFGVGVYSDANAKESSNIAKKDFTTTSMNDIVTTHEGEYNPTTIFLSMNIKSNKNTKSRTFTSANNQRVRYVQFKGFITAFDRNVKAGYTLNTNKNRSIGISTINQQVKSKLDDLNYNVSFDVPAYNLEEAKKNCGKIQYLARMFARSEDADIPALTEAGQEVKNKLNKRDLKVYIPNFIESKNSWGKFDTFDNMYRSALDLVITNFSFEVDVAAGFFEELTDKNKPRYIYPKVMKITLSMEHLNPSEVLKNFMIDSDAKGHKTVGNRSEQDHLFPFRRPHTTIRKK